MNDPWLRVIVPLIVVAGLLVGCARERSFVEREGGDFSVKNFIKHEWVLLVGCLGMLILDPLIF